MYAYERVCSKCLIHEDFFETDWDSLVSSCPKCGGTDYTRYEKLGWTSRSQARNLKEEWDKKEVRKYVLKMTAFGYGVIIIAFVILFCCN